MIYGIPHFLLGLFLLGSPALPTERSVERAYLEKTGEICFDLPQGLVDWEALAKKTLGKKLAQPDREALLRPYIAIEGTTISELRYPVPVPSQVSGRVWRLLHEDGELVLRPELLALLVRYDVDKNLKVLGPPHSRGQACASLPGKKLRPAFVFGGERGDWSFVPVKWSAEKDRHWLLDSGGRYRVKAPMFACSEIRRVLVFRSGGSLPRALVSWGQRSDDVCCEFAFSLFELGPEGRVVELSESGYRCDL